MINILRLVNCAYSSTGRVLYKDRRLRQLNGRVRMERAKLSC